jgi:DNA-binding HxlR family transcriptional regulator
VTTYQQYCPIARGAEIFAERWTPLIIRNLYLGCRTFTEILDGAPGMSRTLLTERLRTMERNEIIERHPRTRGRGFTYHLTPAGAELVDVCIALGNWGARWLEIAPEHLGPHIVLWNMARLADRTATGCCWSPRTPRSACCRPATRRISSSPPPRNGSPSGTWAGSRCPPPRTAG